jgi:16S rRNA processing protein RimM
MERIIIGKVLSPHGVKGEVRVLPLTDFPERFQKTKSVWSDARNTYLEIENIREQKEYLLIKFAKVNNRDQAEELTNSYLTIDREQLMELSPGHYYHFQIIGLRVYDLEGSYLGEVTDILETGANDVYVVRRTGKKDLLIPALKIIVKEIDIKEKQMIVQLLPGLDD